MASDVAGDMGRPHDRTFEVAAMVDEKEVGRGRGRSKKQAEQEAARLALDVVEGPPDPEDDEEED